MNAELVKKPKEFVKEYLDEYLADGLGAKTKREIDILVMHLLMKYAGLAERSNQELSILLQAPVSKIRSLRYEARLKYPPDADYVKREFLYVLGKAQCDFERDKIIFAIEDDFLRYAIQGELKAKGMFADTSFNSEIVKIDKVSLYQVLCELYGEKIANDFRAGFDEMDDQLEGEDAAAEFRSTILKFVVETAKTVGLELARSRIGL